jgi:hypothetical protein
VCYVALSQIWDAMFVPYPTDLSPIKPQPVVRFLERDINDVSGLFQPLLGQDLL